MAKRWFMTTTGTHLYRKAVALDPARVGQSNSQLQTPKSTALPILIRRLMKISPVLDNTIYTQALFDRLQILLLELTNEREFYERVKIYFTKRDSPFVPAYRAICGDVLRIPCRYGNTAIDRVTDFPDYSRDQMNELLRFMLYCYYYQEFVAPHAPEYYVTPSLSQIKILEKLRPTPKPIEVTPMSTSNFISKFEDQALVTVKLIHGKPVEDYSEAELIDLIRKAKEQQSAISDLVDVSKRMADKHASIAKNIEVYVKALDALK